MNVNSTLTCATCGGDIDVRFGFSNRDVQPWRFACPHCESRIDVTLESGRGFTYDGAALVPERQPRAIFDGSHPFVDLHLDFPVWPGAYVQGHTPFMVAAGKVRAGSTDQGLSEIGLHARRMEQLNLLATESGTIRQLIRLYRGKNRQLFAKRTAEFLGEEGRNYEPEQDRNALLYRFVSGVFEPFLKMDTVRLQVDYFTSTIMRLAAADRGAFDAMMERFEKSGFLVNVQQDCLELYPEIFEAELPLRAALFLDFTEDQGKGTAARISLADFNTYKDLYKDISEVFGRQLVLVAAINNLDKRGNADSFLKPKDGNALSSLDKLADKTLSERFKYLDDSWYAVDPAVVNTGVRNAIAHYVTEYDELTQVVTYFPEKEGIRQDQGETMTLLDFMRMLLTLFREMHSLHHLIKSLLFYEALVRKRA